MVCHFFGYKKALKTVWLRALSGAARSGIDGHYNLGNAVKKGVSASSHFPLTTY